MSVHITGCDWLCCSLLQSPILARHGSLRLHYSPSVWSRQRQALEIELPGKDVTFRDVLYAALDQLQVLDGRCESEDDVFGLSDDDEEWLILEVWNGLERRVALSECPTHLLRKWGSFVSQIQLVLRPKEKLREHGAKGRPKGGRHRSNRHTRRLQLSHYVAAVRAVAAKRQSLQSVDHFLQVLKRCGSVQKDLATVTKHLRSVEKDIHQEEDLEKLRQRAQFLKKETEAKNELNSMQHAKMNEQTALLEEKTRVINNLRAELAELRGQRAGSAGPAPSARNSSSESEADSQKLRRYKPGSSRQFQRASICDDGRYLAESLEGKHRAGYHTPPTLTKAQSTGSPPRFPGNSFQRRSFTPQSSKRRSEQESLTRKNNEEGLVLKFSEERRKSMDSVNKDWGSIVEDRVSKKLSFGTLEEETPTTPEGVEPEDQKHPKIRKTKSLQLEVFQGEMQSQSLLPGKPEEGNLGLTQTGEEPSKLRGILKGGQTWTARDKVDVVRPTLEKAVKFDGVSMLFSAAMEGEFEVFVEASRQLCAFTVTSYQGVSPLHYAVCSGSMDIVRYSVSHGVNVNQQDHEGWTPLHCSASCSNLEMVQFLIHNGASVFTKTVDGQTPLRVAYEEFEDSGEGEGSAASECLDYLLFVQQELGSINGGVVYALFSYAPDEEGYTVDEESGLPFLSLQMNESLRVLSKGRGHGEEEEGEVDQWWVAENKQKQKGLVPCTLLGSYPRCIGGKV